MSNRCHDAAMARRDAVIAEVVGICSFSDARAIVSEAIPSSTSSFGADAQLPLP
jgi:hypothetical protein